MTTGCHRKKFLPSDSIVANTAFIGSVAMERQSIMRLNRETDGSNVSCMNPRFVMRLGSNCQLEIRLIFIHFTIDGAQGCGER